jgi:CBS domain-containing protein
MKISECMTRDVHTISLDNSLQSAAQIMGDLDCGFLPVVDGERIAGIVTDRDIAVRGVARGFDANAGIGDVMSQDVCYCFEDDTAEDVLINMSDIQVRRLPVLDRAKKLVGIVSLSDLASNGEAPAAGVTLGDIARPSECHSQRL